MRNSELLNTIYQYFPKNEMPLLMHSLERIQDMQPYKGVRIIHNTHLTLSTLCKLYPLLVSGAEVTVTVTKELKSHRDAESILHEVGVNLIKENDIEDRYDLSLDCCAGLKHYVNPHLGAIELTQTGSVRYKEGNICYPVLSVDDSNLKNIETLLGTGDGFLRAFLEITKEDIVDQSFVLFGYGKVGKGIVRALKPYTKNIIIIEKNEKAIEAACKNGLQAINVNKAPEVYKHIRNKFCVITATGETGVVSKYFDRTDFDVTYFANIGSEDEFGHKFHKREVLFEKAPINFSLVEPTRARFLDPIFYAHNCGIDFLINNNLKAGFYKYPKDMDKEILNKWLKYFDYDISEYNINDYE